MENAFDELREIVNLYENIKDEKKRTHMVSFMNKKIEKLTNTLDSKYLKNIIQNKQIYELEHVREKSITTCHRTLKDFFPFMLIHLMNQQIDESTN